MYDSTIYDYCKLIVFSGSVRPPSTVITCPQIISAAGEHRKATTPATSSGVTSRPGGRGCGDLLQDALFREGRKVLDHIRRHHPRRDCVHTDVLLRQFDGHIAGQGIQGGLWMRLPARIPASPGHRPGLVIATICPPPRFSISRTASWAANR